MGLYSELTGLTQDESYNADKWTWGYKYNHAGVREQKQSFSICEGELTVIYN